MIFNHETHEIDEEKLHSLRFHVYHQWPILLSVFFSLLSSCILLLSSYFLLRVLRVLRG
jgi:hypothetical protein